MLFYSKDYNDVDDDDGVDDDDEVLNRYSNERKIRSCRSKMRLQNIRMEIYKYKIYIHVRN